LQFMLIGIVISCRSCRSCYCFLPIHDP
jgi:hypothetical protein